jgi:hypothetical protein
MKATKLLDTTLIGTWEKEFPMKRANCFAVEVDGKRMKVVNMGWENLEHLIDTQLMDWPIEVEPVPGSTRHVEIVDPRVPKNYLERFWCEACIPINFIPWGNRRCETCLGTGKARTAQQETFECTACKGTGAFV